MILHKIENLLLCAGRAFPTKLLKPHAAVCNYVILWISLVKIYGVQLDIREDGLLVENASAVKDQLTEVT